MQEEKKADTFSCHFLLFQNCFISFLDSFKKIFWTIKKWHRNILDQNFYKNTKPENEETQTKSC